jgi:WhiB family transcriptional regulator, redox-sensing transcriptional regulator
VRIPVRPDWHADANCRGLNPEIFYPGQGASTAEAKAICRECDVQVECLTVALNEPEVFGIWGGLSERQRQRARRARNRAQAA